MNPIIQGILLALAGVVTAALVPLGPILAGLMKLLGLWVITRMSVHSTEQKAKVAAKLGQPLSNKEREDMAAANVALLTKWCGLSDATTVLPIANEAHVFGLPSNPVVPPVVPTVSVPSVWTVPQNPQPTSTITTATYNPPQETNEAKG